MGKIKVYINIYGIVFIVSVYSIGWRGFGTFKLIITAPLVKKQNKAAKCE